MAKRIVAYPEGRYPDQGLSIPIGFGSESSFIIRSLDALTDPATGEQARDLYGTAMWIAGTEFSHPRVFGPQKVDFVVVINDEDARGIKLAIQDVEMGDCYDLAVEFDEVMAHFRREGAILAAVDPSFYHVADDFERTYWDETLESAFGAVLASE